MLPPRPPQEGTMPVRHELDPESGCLVVVGKGTITARDILGDADVVSRDPAYDHATRVLLDFTKIDAIDLRLSDALELISNIRQYREHRIEKRAVAVSRSFDFGLCRMLSAYAEHRGVMLRPFHELEKARKWLCEQPAFPDVLASVLPDVHRQA
jgi:hypothetical protein